MAKLTMTVKIANEEPKVMEVGSFSREAFDANVAAMIGSGWTAEVVVSEDGKTVVATFGKPDGSETKLILTA